MPDHWFHRDASGRLSFEMFKIPGEAYFTICQELATALQLEPIGTLVTDFGSTLFQDYRRGSEVVGLEWDNWSGFIVVAKTPESEPLVEAIADWLSKSKWASVSGKAES